MIAFLCPTCGQKHQVRDSFAGRTGTCKHCGTQLFVPEALSSIAAAPIPPAEPWQNIDSGAPIAVHQRGASAFRWGFGVTFGYLAAQFTCCLSIMAAIAVCAVLLVIFWPLSKQPQPNKSESRIPELTIGTVCVPAVDRGLAMGDWSLAEKWLKAVAAEDVAAQRDLYDEGGVFQLGRDIRLRILEGPAKRAGVWCYKVRIIDGHQAGKTVVVVYRDIVADIRLAR